MNKGKIVLVPFPFTDLSTNKIRPCLILHNLSKGEDLIVAFISSHNTRIGRFDVLVKPTPRNGLKTDSLIKVNKIATLHKKIALGEIGYLESKMVDQVDKKLKELFKLK